MTRRLRRLRPALACRAALVVAAAVTTLGLASRACADSLTYSITDVGLLPSGNFSLGLGLNASGQVSGVAGNGNGYEASLTAANGANIHGLGTLGGSYGEGWGVNAHGQVAGWSNTSGNQYQHAFVTDANGTNMRDLGALGTYGAGYSFSNAYGINDSGQVAGYSSTSSGNGHAFLTEANGGAMHDLGALGTYGNGNSYSEGHAVNNNGQVTGISDNSAGYGHAFLTDANGANMRDIGTLGTYGSGYSYSEGWGVNASGQVAGYSVNSAGYGHAFLTDANGANMQDLGALYTSSYGYSYSRAWGLNDAGAAVGESDAGNGYDHAFIDVNGVMQDLNAMLDSASAGTGWTLISARAINDSGQIAGFGIIGNEEHAFLLTPDAPAPDPNGAAAPLPSTAWAGLGLLGCVGGAQVVRRRKAAVAN